MHTKTMEGLIGARTNMEMLNTPFRVYKEARLKGDTAMMERAMGYMKDFHEDAYEYKEEADEGMKKDAEETREIAEKQREEMIQNRREEREENKNDKIVDTVEISEDGKVLLKENSQTAESDADGTDVETGTSPKPKADLEPVFYSSAGEVKQSEDTGVNVSASV